MSTMRSQTGFAPVLAAWAALVLLTGLSLPAAAHAQPADAALRVVGLRTEYQ
jgi:hypothetical protein